MRIGNKPVLLNPGIWERPKWLPIAVFSAARKIELYKVA